MMTSIICLDPDYLPELKFSYIQLFTGHILVHLELKLTSFPRNLGPSA